MILLLPPPGSNLMENCFWVILSFIIPVPHPNASQQVFSTFFILVGLQFMTNSKPVSFSVTYPNNYSHKIPMLFYTHIAFFNPAFQRSCESECQTDRGNGRQNPEHSKYQKFLYGMNGWLNCLCLRGHLHSPSIAVFDRFACCSSAASG
jgi:hypothetical protein